jgi:hypothetical protein
MSKVKPDGVYSMKVLIFTQEQVVMALGIKHTSTDIIRVYCDGDNKVRIEVLT